MVWDSPNHFASGITMKIAGNRDMRLINSVGLLMVCLILGCSIFKKEKTTIDSNTSNVVAVDTTSVDTIAMETKPLLLAKDTIPPPKLPLEYMTIEEKAMIDEINILRADPRAYIQYVDAYIQDFLADESWDFSAKQAEKNAGQELIRQLSVMPPLSILKPDEALYKVAMRHGKDMKASKMIRHRGTDDSFPADRIQDSTRFIGSENLAAGGRSIRESLIMLLVDSNDRVGRNHRKTILNPVWEYLACYDAGTVNDIPNAWVQLFAYPDPSEIIEESSTESQSELIEEGGGNKRQKPNDRPVDIDDFSYMTDIEKSMIDEINLLRSKPKKYIKHLDQYVVEHKKNMIGGDSDFDMAVEELKNELNSIKTLSSLKPHKKLYNAAKAHGLDNKKHHQLEHRGTDGRSSFQRVKDSGLKNSISFQGSQGDYAPNENLAAGTAQSTVREIVMMLLIDSGISTRGHRKALLEPSWRYVACYHIDKITNLKDYREAGMKNTDAPNCWVQFFAKD